MFQQPQTEPFRVITSWWRLWNRICEGEKKVITAMRSFKKKSQAILLKETEPQPHLRWLTQAISTRNNRWYPLTYAPFHAVMHILIMRVAIVKGAQSKKVKYSAFVTGAYREKVNLFPWIIVHILNTALDIEDSDADETPRPRPVRKWKIKWTWPQTEDNLPCGRPVRPAKTSYQMTLNLRKLF